MLVLALYLRHPQIWGQNEGENVWHDWIQRNHNIIIQIQLWLARYKGLFTLYIVFFWFLPKSNRRKSTVLNKLL